MSYIITSNDPVLSEEVTYRWPSSHAPGHAHFEWRVESYNDDKYCRIHFMATHTEDVIVVR